MSGASISPMSEVDELTAWLTAIWDEDEAVARAVKAAGRPLEGGTGSWFESDRSIGDRTGYVVAYGVEWDAARKHIASHDPAHVLARIAADREILAEHAPAKPSWAGRMERACRTCGTAQIWDQVAYEANCRTLCLLASVFADRPGYREEWKP